MFAAAANVVSPLVMEDSETVPLVAVKATTPELLRIAELTLAPAVVKASVPAEATDMPLVLASEPAISIPPITLVTPW